MCKGGDLLTPFIFHGQDYLVSLGVSEGLRSLANVFQRGIEKKEGAGNESQYKDTDDWHTYILVVSK